MDTITLTAAEVLKDCRKAADENRLGFQQKQDGCYNHYGFDVEGVGPVCCAIGASLVKHFDHDKQTELGIKTSTLFALVRDHVVRVEPGECSDLRTLQVAHDAACTAPSCRHHYPDRTAAKEREFWETLARLEAKYLTAEAA